MRTGSRVVVVLCFVWVAVAAQAAVWAAPGSWVADGVARALDALATAGFASHPEAWLLDDFEDRPWFLWRDEFSQGFAIHEIALYPVLSLPAGSGAAFGLAGPSPTRYISVGAVGDGFGEVVAQACPVPPDTRWGRLGFECVRLAVAARIVVTDVLLLRYLISIALTAGAAVLAVRAVGMPVGRAVSGSNRERANGPRFTSVAWRTASLAWPLPAIVDLTFKAAIAFDERVSTQQGFQGYAASIGPAARTAQWCGALVLLAVIALGLAFRPVADDGVKRRRAALAGIGAAGVALVCYPFLAAWTNRLLGFEPPLSGLPF